MRTSLDLAQPHTNKHLDGILLFGICLGSWCSNAILPHCYARVFGRLLSLTISFACPYCAATRLVTLVGICFYPSLVQCGLLSATHSIHLLVVSRSTATSTESIRCIRVLVATSYPPGLLLWCKCLKCKSLYNTSGIC